MDPLTTPSSRSGGRSKHLETLDLEKFGILRTRNSGGEITPPATPLKAADPDVRDTELNEFETGSKGGLLTFDGTLELGEEIGRGAWSRVFAAREKASRAIISPQKPLTPPASPGSALAATKCYAAKVPSHNWAFTVVKNEAFILSKLTRSPHSSSHIVRFYGFDHCSNSIVLSRCAETLLNLASSALVAERSSPTFRPSADPVIGLRPWLSIAVQLVRGLNWLHNQRVIHGDIKASNILLIPSTTSTTSLSEEQPLKAVYCDFSSSRLLSSPDDVPPLLPTDAITTSYASPELLRSYSRSYSPSNSPSDAASPTRTSDAWALAVTLIVAAVGEDPYVHTGNEMRKLAMAKEGLVLEGVRMGEWKSSMRVKRGGFVERAVIGALVRRVEARWGLEEWVGALERIAREVKNLEPS